MLTKVYLLLSVDCVSTSSLVSTLVCQQSILLLTNRYNNNHHHHHRHQDPLGLEFESTGSFEMINHDADPMMAVKSEPGAANDAGLFSNSPTHSNEGKLLLI